APRSDDGEKGGEEKEEVEWEGIGLWCARVEGSTAVVCEIGITEREDFGSYVPKRDGVPIWSYSQQTMPGRPWPDVRYVDEAAPAGGAKYTAYIKDSNGNWVGGSGHVWIDGMVEPEPPATTMPETTEPETTVPPTTVPPTTVPESTTTTVSG
ncbi:MAG: hypothetical protein P8N02_19930, partial [Actinomycetota bacterium]|nr:hypothetical protein [Actinomycetota bacterium]